MEAIFNYFKKTELSNKVVCKICKKQLCSSRNYNLKAHLKQAHQIEILTTKKGTNRIKKRTKTKITNGELEINKHELIRSYIGLVTENGVPFDVLNGKNMRNILKPICSALSAGNDKMFCLDAENATQILSDVVIKLRSSIRNELSNKLFSVKIDSTTRLERNIFGISLQYCKDGNILSRLIGIVDLSRVGPTKSENLASEIIKTLSKYDLGLQQVIAITSDNGANMLNTTSLLSQCIAKYKDDDALDNDDYVMALNEICNDSDLNIGDITICRCAAYTAQLVAIDVIQNVDVKAFVLQCRNFTKFLRQPTNGFRCLFDLNKVRIPQIDCPTRWGSTFRMISDLKSSKSLIDNAEIKTYTIPEEFFEVNEKFWENVEDFLLVFDPLNQILNKFQEESLNYSDFYAHWLKCKLIIKKVVEQSSENSFARILGESVLEYIEERSVKLLSNDILKACLYFDPRFQHTLSYEEKGIAIDCVKKHWDRFVSLNKEYSNKPNNSIKNEPIHDEEDILTQFLRQDITEDNEVDTHTQIERLKLPFLKSDTCVLNYWKDRRSTDPELYIIANIIFGVPPNQVAIEREFSSLRIILTESRNRLSHDSLENILLAKLNPPFLDDTICEINFLE